MRLLADADNPVAVHSSKAVGEPPFFLGAATYFALRQAVRAAREQEALSGMFVLNSPATSERLRMACADELAAFGVSSTHGKEGKDESVVSGANFEVRGSF